MPLAITLNNQQFSNKVDYWYFEFPSIYMLDPNRGPDTGGTHVLLKGNNFDPFGRYPIKNYNDTFCRFGPLGLVPAQVLNSTKVICVSPPSFVLREVVVEITLNNQEFTRDGNIFYYYRPPFVYDIEPLMGPVAGGTEVHVHGSNFEDTGTIRCKFGDHIVPGKYVNVNELLCVSPRTDKPGYVPFQVAVHEDDFSSADIAQFLYYDTPMINYVEPTCGPERGYTQITIYGQNFIDPGFDMVYCVFNKTIFMNATVFEPDQIKCSSPPVLNAHGVNENNVRFYDIEITLNRKDLNGPKKRFYYYKEVTLKGVNPPGGPIEGNTTVQIFGKGFRPESACNVTERFGTFQIRPINFTENIVFAKTPNVSLADDVVVSHGINGQQYNPDITLNYRDPENTYTYYSQPVVVAYEPKRGPSSGGTKITFSGYGFTPYKDREGNPTVKPVWVRMRQVGGKEQVPPSVAEYVDPYVVQWTTPAARDGDYLIEMSLNGQDYLPVLVPTNATSSFTYYPGPHVTALYPAFGPTDPNADVMIFVKGKNFKCPNDTCDRVVCRFGIGQEAIYSKGTLVSSTEIHCLAPKYTRPDVLPLEISLSGEHYTSDGKEYGFYSPYVWKVSPKMVSRRGNTTVTIYGYGFVNTTGSFLKARYGYLHKKLVCKGGPCAVMATYMDKNHIKATTFPYSDVTYEESGLPVGSQEFPVEVSVYGDHYTENNVTIFYFSEPIYGDPEPNTASENGGEMIRVPTDFLTGQPNPENDEEMFREYGNVTCRFSSLTGKAVETSGVFAHYPLGEAETYNTIFCKSPEWQLPENADEEILVLDVSVNGGADYSGHKSFRITKRLELYRIYPTCGPTYGGTVTTIVGTGMRRYQNLHLKWGVINSLPLDASGMETLIYNKDIPLSTNPFENEIISQNEEAKLLFKEKGKYEIIRTVSPRLPNWDQTHGGQVYLQLGRTGELQMVDSKTLRVHDYGPSYMEYYYYKQPKVKDMWPHAGTTTGGTRVMIRGCWFKYMPEYGVIPYARFGDKIAKCHFESTVRIICMTPPNNDTETQMPVAVSLNGIDFTMTDFTYHYYVSPIIQDISPKSGPESGGSQVRLIGPQFSNLSSGTEFMCRFQPVDYKSPPKFIPAVYENSTSIICRSPGGWGSGSKVYVDVTFNGEDYTDAKMEFYFYSVVSANPRSGPSDGTAGTLYVSGSGFKDSENVYCAFDGTKYKPLEVSWTQIKCRIPKPKYGDDFFGAVPLEVSLNGIDSHRFEGGFQYYPQINVTDFYPRTGPAKGRGLVKFYGTRFRADFAQAQPACRFGKYIGKAEILNDHEMLCHIPDIDTINQTYKGEAALNGQAFVKASSNSLFVPYGIYDTDPNGGPINAQTQVYVSGEGFSAEGKPKCRFGIPGSYAIVDGVVLSKKRMVCVSPKGFEIPKISDLPLSVPFSISFFEEKVNPWTGMKYTTKGIADKAPHSGEGSFDPWTETGHVFRFYTQPLISRITPNIAKVRQIIDVYVFANPNTPFIEPIAPTSAMDIETGIKCSFGRFGVTTGVYLNSSTIRCVTPNIKEDPSTIREEHVHLKVALNGHDFTAENPYTLFTFVGTATVFTYWPYIVGIILGVLALIALIMCCSAMFDKIPKIFQPEEPAEDRAKRAPPAAAAPGGAGSVPGIAQRPHTIRDEFGLFRTRAMYMEKPASPSPSLGRSTLQYPRGTESRRGGQYLSPMPGAAPGSHI